MSKQAQIEDAIPDSQNEASLLAMADFFESAAKQCRFAAEQLKGESVEVVGTPTVRLGYKHVRNWLGNLFQAISSASLDRLPVEKRREDAENAERKAEEIKRNKIVKPDLKPKRKAE